MMAPLQGPADEPGFPPGFEHLDASQLVEGYTDHGAYAEWTAGIEKSPNDARDYRLIRLQNGLECMLVHDPAAQKCTASMAVRVGHFQDPEELPGLAHFLEHLLFMGSAKFPGENEYSDHLSKHNGWSNAYTSAWQTVYYFEVMHSGFEGALDRFSQFFISPLFKETCVEREIQAVDSEHQKNLQADNWRFHQTVRSLAKPEHPYHKFGTGSLDTLWTQSKAKGLDIRAELLKFYDKHYSANLMKLCIISGEPLETSLEHALSFFNQVANQGLPPTVFPNNPYSTELDMCRIGIKQIRERNFLWIQMPFYEASEAVGSKPATVISYILGNESPSSLYGFLKRKGLVTSVSGWPSSPGPGIYFYIICCSLTEEGLKQHQLVTAAIFEYIRLLKNTQPFPTWVHQEVQKVLANTYRFLEGSSSISDDADVISTSLHEPYSRSQILSAPYKLAEYDPEAIKAVLGYLIKDKAQVFICSHSEIEGLKYDKREKWYGTEYRIDALKPEWFDNDGLKDEKLTLPAENQFIPTDFSLVRAGEAVQPIPRPLLIKQTEGQRMWFKQDDKWKLPKGFFYIKLSNPFLSAEYKNVVLADSYIHLVEEALTGYASAASTGGLHYGISCDSMSLRISVSGFTEKLPSFYKHILYQLKNLKVTPEAFTLMQEQSLKHISNISHSSPTKQCQRELDLILGMAGATVGQRKDILQAMKPEDIVAFSKELLSNFYAEALCNGNFTKETMYELVNMTEEALDYSRLPREAIKPARSRILPEKSNYIVRFPTSSEEEVNNGICYYTNIGHPDDEDNVARMMLLTALMREPCFNVLRTQEQLGYIVSLYRSTRASAFGMCIVIQSARRPVYLESRINAFLEGFTESLQTMDIDKFESAKTALIADLLEPFKNQGDEHADYWYEISSGRYDFFERDRFAAMLKPLSLKDMNEFFMKYIHPSSETRAKLSIQAYSRRIHIGVIDKLVETMEEHKIDSEPIKKFVKDEQPLSKSLREAVAKHVNENAPGLHRCCKEEILREVDILSEYPDFEKELPGSKVIGGRDLKYSLAIGEPRKPVGNYYDGVAKL